MKPVMTSVAGAAVAMRPRADQLRELRARLLPLHGRAERPPLDHDAAARVDPLHALAHAALAADSGRTDASTRSRQSRRSDRGHALRRRAHHARGLQHPRKIGAVAIEFGQVLGRRCAHRAARRRWRHDAPAGPPAARASSHRVARPAPPARSSSSVTPLQADSTTATRACACGARRRTATPVTR